MKPNMVHREAEIVVGIADGFTEGAHDAMGSLWNKFLPRVSEIENAKPGYLLGLCFDSHPEVHLDSGETFVYMAGAPVQCAQEHPKNMVRFCIPASKYAAFTHKGTLAGLPETLKFIWATWAPAHSGLVKTGAPLLEVYDDRFRADSPDSEFDILVPVNER